MSRTRPKSRRRLKRSHSRESIQDRSLTDGLSLGDLLHDLWSFYKYTPFYIMGFYWFLTALIFCQIIGSVLSLIINSNIKIGILLLLASFPFFCLLPPNFIEHYHFSFIW